MQLDQVIDRLKSEVKNQMLLRDISEAAPIDTRANARLVNTYNATLHQECIKAIEILGEWQRYSMNSISDLNKR